MAQAVPYGRAGAVVLVAAALFGLGACSRDTDNVTEDDPAVVSGVERGEDDDQLAQSISCAVDLDAVAHLPASTLESDVPEESDDPKEVAGEHASLGAAYRAQASNLATSLGIAPAELARRFAAEQSRIGGERKSRSPDDFALWIGGEADACPAI